MESIEDELWDKVRLVCAISLLELTDMSIDSVLRFVKVDDSEYHKFQAVIEDRFSQRI